MSSSRFSISFEGGVGAIVTGMDWLPSPSQDSITYRNMNGEAVVMSFFRKERIGRHGTWGVIVSYINPLSKDPLTTILAFPMTKEGDELASRIVSDWLTMAQLAIENG